MRKSLSFSFLIHVIFIALLIAPFFWHDQETGNMKKIEVHLTSTAFLFNRTSASEEQKANGEKQKLLNSTLPKQNISGKTNQLAIFLHDAIQRSLENIHLSSEGDYTQNVTLNFLVSEKGKINSIHLAQSTGDSYIDNKIISRVKNINIPRSLLTAHSLSFQIGITLK